MPASWPPDVIEYQFLGPLNVVLDGRPAVLDGVRLRALMARLLLDADRSVSADRLIEDVWNGQSSRKGLQVAVGRLRAALGCPVTGGVLSTRGNGYSLGLREPDLLDVRSFEGELARSRELLPTDPQRSLVLVERAVSRWRGPALEEFADFAWALAEAQRVEQLRMDALEVRREAQLALGAGAELVAELESLVTVDPGRERAWEQLMLALYRAGRQLDSLRTFHRARAYLVEEHGVEPAEPMRALHQAILLQDPALTPRPRRLDRMPGRRLPLPLTTFVGRDSECAELASLLLGERLVTLTGVGGAGKSRLAIAVAEKTTAAEQVFFVDLTPASGEGQVEEALLQSLGLTEQPGRRPMSVLEEFLAPESVMLVLDNCEHVLAEAAATTARLLQVCGELRVLATSRARLGVPGELVWRVPPLSLVGTDPAESDAVRLLIERARRVRPDFVLDANAVDLAVEICRRLDGLPLAIELAAARLRILSLGEVVSALGDQLSLLGGGPQVAAARQQTLRASIAWSEALLSERERKLLHRLAVFSGGSTVSETRSVCCDDDVPAADLYDLLMALVDNSLVVADTRSDTARYRLPEPVRQYGLEALDRHGQLGRWRQRHLSTFAAILEEMDRNDRLIDPSGLELYDAVHPNLLAAFQEALDQKSLTAVHMASALADYWVARGRIADGARRLEHALAVAPHEASPERCIGLSYLSVLRLHEGDPRRALSLGYEALEMSALLEDPEARALARMRVGLIQGIPDPQEGLALVEEAIALMRDRPGRILSFARHCHVDLVGQTDDWSRIEPSLTEAMALARSLGHQTVMGWCSVRLAHRAEATADLPALRRHAEEVISGQDDPLVRSFGVASLAQALVLEGSPAEAEEVLLGALERLQPGQGMAVSVLKTGLGGAALALENVDEAESALAPATLAPAWLMCTADLLRIKVALRQHRTGDASRLARRLHGKGERLGNRRAQALGDLGSAAAYLYDGDEQRARETAGPALRALADGRFVLHVLEALELSAGIDASDDAARATRLLASTAAERSRRGIRVPHDGAWTTPGSLTARLEALLGPVAFDEEWQEAWGWSLDNALHHCCAVPSPSA